MSRTRGRNANMSFLYGSVFFFFIIIVTIGLFAYFSLYKYWEKPGDKRFAYEISFAPDFAGTAYNVYVNDSLLYVGNPVDTDSVVRFNRFAGESALLLVNAATDGVAIFSLPDRGRVRVSRNGGEPRVVIKK